MTRYERQLADQRANWNRALRFARCSTRYERQLADQRANWNRALRFARCSKCGAKILEINMPNVICSECSTRYILAIQVGIIRMSSKLIEQSNEEKVITKEKEVIVKIRCPYCHGLYDETLNSCPHCGAHV
jgi:DNA-directed RNA polymerase subunit RPC12/RpoP